MPKTDNFGIADTTTFCVVAGDVCFLEAAMLILTAEMRRFADSQLLAESGQSAIRSRLADNWRSAFDP